MSSTHDRCDKVYLFFQTKGRVSGPKWWINRGHVCTPSNETRSCTAMVEADVYTGGDGFHVKIAHERHGDACPGKRCSSRKENIRIEVHTVKGKKRLSVNGLTGWKTVGDCIPENFKFCWVNGKEVYSE